MRNPNGYGSVVKLSGNRRKPYAVRKTAGWNEKGHPIYEHIGYAATREEGLMMLAEYNRKPYDVAQTQLTVEEVHELWLTRAAHKLGLMNFKSLRTAWGHCATLYNMRYRDMRTYHMQECIDGCGAGASTQASIRNLFNHMDRFALELDIIDKGYAHLTTTIAPGESTRVPFSEAEIDALWAVKDRKGVDSVLVLLYTGWRISELLSLRREDVDLTNMTLRGGVKTESGKNRIVPIHPRILPFIEARLADGHTYLFGEELGYDYLTSYYRVWRAICRELGMTHTPHECRHTFRSRLDSAGANKRCIDLLMGHKSKDVGERVYTHKTLEELRATISVLD